MDTYYKVIKTFHNLAKRCEFIAFKNRFTPTKNTSKKTVMVYGYSGETIATLTIDKKNAFDSLREETLRLMSEYNSHRLPEIMYTEEAAEALQRYNDDLNKILSECCKESKFFEKVAREMSLRHRDDKFTPDFSVTGKEV